MVMVTAMTIDDRRDKATLQHDMMSHLVRWRPILSKQEYCHSLHLSMLYSNGPVHSTVDACYVKVLSTDGELYNVGALHCLFPQSKSLVSFITVSE
jgi:hypothetical protein